VLTRLIDKAIAACGAVAMVSIVGMGALITIDVVMRSVGYGVVRGGVETVEYLMFLSALFAAPWVLRHNAHIRIDFLLENASRPIALVVEVVINVVGLVVVGIFIFYTARIGLQSAEEARRIYKNFIFPEWWIYAAASIALAVLWIEFLRRMLRPLGGRQAQTQNR
jgi:TRAP-type transport system small permease protein